jgi:hypothetical protein
LVAQKIPEGNYGLGIDDYGDGWVGHTGQLIGWESVVAYKTEPGAVRLMHEPRLRLQRQHVPQATLQWYKTMSPIERVKQPKNTVPIEQQPRRVIGKRRGADVAERVWAASGPTAEEIEWIRSMSQYRTRVPKGVFRYRSHAEANADWERWHAELVAETVRQREDA